MSQSQRRQTVPLAVTVGVDLGAVRVGTGSWWVVMAAGGPAAALPELAADEVAVDLSAPIGAGSYGAVFGGTLRRRGAAASSRVACKSFHFIRIGEMWTMCFGPHAADSGVAWARFVREIHDELESMARFRHPRCVPACGGS